MSAAARARRAEPIHATFLAAVQLTWAAAPVVVAASIAWALAALPVVMVIIARLPVAWVAFTLPFFLATTSTFRVWAAVATRHTVRWRDLASVDPALALTVWSLVMVIWELLSLGDAGVIMGSLFGAVGALVLPLSFAYGAVRERRGVQAVRGGVVLATLRPDLAVTLAGMIVLAGFTLVVSAGSLVLCAPALVAVFACAAVSTDLDRLGVVAPEPSNHHGTGY